MVILSFVSLIVFFFISDGSAAMWEGLALWLLILEILNKTKSLGKKDDEQDK